tara:strand:+ start:238 stop:516 length:279 start_codon:yes stop_codon:yes gene_type:complete
MELDLNEIELINCYVMDKYTGKRIPRRYNFDLEWNDENVEESKQFKLLDKLLKETIRLEDIERKERERKESEKVNRYWRNQAKKSKELRGTK